MEMADEDYGRKIIEALGSAEVMSIFFVRVGQSLIVDFRQSPDGDGMATIDDMVATPQDRLTSFKRLRPELPVPERITLVPWTAAVREFAEEGVLEALIDRCGRDGGLPLQAQASRGYRRLIAKEQRYLRDLVRGIGMHTMWERSRTAEGS